MLHSCGGSLTVKQRSSQSANAGPNPVRRSKIHSESMHIILFS